MATTATATSKYILSEEVGGVLSLTLNRPDVLNSFNAAMATELMQALKEAAKPSVRSVLLTGKGRGFCAGQDLAEVAPRPDGSLPDLGEIVSKLYNPIILAIRNLEKPVVCAVNGVAAGAGANLALACDIVLASETASFIQAFSMVGLIPDSGGTFILPRLIGVARATALTMLAEKLSAKDAESIGLIYRAMPAPNLMKEAQEIALKLSVLPTRGLWFTKKLFNESFANSLEEQLALEEKFQKDAGKTNDYREGVVAFLEKRAPKFTGS